MLDFSQYTAFRYDLTNKAEPEKLVSRESEEVNSAMELHLSY